MSSPYHAPNFKPYADLLAHQRQTALLSSTASLLGWDQEVLMPPGGLTHRGDQLAQLAHMTHERSTLPQVNDWLAACEGNAELMGDPHHDAAVNVREWRRAYDRETKLPASLVVEFSRATTQAKAEWQAARQASDFSRFAPSLTKVVELCRQQATCYGWDPVDGEPWDALAEGYEVGLNAKSVNAVFADLRPRLVQLIQRLTQDGKPPGDAFAMLPLPRDKQLAFVRDIIQTLGFDFERGRLDTSAHPFCTGFHPGDVRLTTRFHDNMLHDALGSSMHEMGHGLYEQGLPAAHLGTPRGSAVGLSIHESQSRLWENQVGRSRSFWTWAFPRLQQHFGTAVSSLDEAAVYGSVNRVQPSLIRVEADEATYNLHIMIRFDLERAMLRGDLAVKDLPGEWNRLYHDYLGVTVPSDAKGCLQDIHWSMGALGYFPTYTLGNLHAAQFYEAAEQQLGELNAMFAAGNFAPLLHWLREHIHRHGQTFTTAELCERVTGKPLTADPLIRHLEQKFLPLYGLA